MATGILGTAELLTATYQVVYTVPTSYIGICTVTVCNQHTAQNRVRLALTENTLTPSTAEFIEYDALLTAAGTTGNVLEKSGLVLDAGRKIVAYALSANASCVVYGFEE